MMENIDIIDLEDKKIDEVNNTLNDIESFMKKESITRQKIISKATEDLDNHSKRIIEYNQKAKELDIVVEKYKKLYKKYQIVETEAKKIVDERNIIDEEMTKMKKEIIFLNKTNSTLKTILNIVEKKVGTKVLSEATGIPVDKLKEYLS